MAHSSIDRDSNPLADSPSAFGISRLARNAAPQATHDSMDMILDPRLASLSRPSRRISTVPRIAIPKFAVPEVVREAVPESLPGPLLEFATSEPPERPDARALPARQRPGRTQRAAVWAIAAVAAMSIGGFTGRLTRPQPRAHAIAPWVAMHVQPPAIGLVEASETAPTVHENVAAPSPIEVEHVVLPEPVAAPEVIAVPAHTHSIARASSRANNNLSETAAAAIPGPAALHVEARSAEPATAVRVESRSASNSSCSARCGDDLACAAACVVRGPRAESGREIAARPSAPTTAPEATPVPEALEGPSRDDVAHAIESVLPAVQACAGEEQHSVAHVSITFASSGRVTTANTETPYAGTPAGSCIARAVRTARVPPFTRPMFTVRAPFTMR